MFCSNNFKTAMIYTSVNHPFSSENFGSALDFMPLYVFKIWFFLRSESSLMKIKVKEKEVVVKQVKKELTSLSTKTSHGQ